MKVSELRAEEQERLKSLLIKGSAVRETYLKCACPVCAEKAVTRQPWYATFRATVAGHGNDVIRRDCPDCAVPMHLPLDEALGEGFCPACGSPITQEVNGGEIRLITEGEKAKWTAKYREKAEWTLQASRFAALIADKTRDPLAQVPYSGWCQQDARHFLDVLYRRVTPESAMADSMEALSSLVSGGVIFLDQGSVILTLARSREDGSIWTDEDEGVCISTIACLPMVGLFAHLDAVAPGKVQEIFPHWFTDKGDPKLPPGWGSVPQEERSSSGEPLRHPIMSDLQA